MIVSVLKNKHEYHKKLHGNFLKDSKHLIRK